MSSALRNANPLVPANRLRTEQRESQDSPITTPLASILANPKQKLTTQFKRAITAIKQRTDGSNDSVSTPSSPAQTSLVEKPVDSTVLTSLVEEPHRTNESSGQMSNSSTLTPKSQSYVHLKNQPSRSSSNQKLDPNNSSTATILTIDPPNIRTSNPSARLVKQSLQQIHSSILQTMNQHHPVSPTTTTSSSATLSPTPTSSSTIGTGEVAILETIL